MSISSFFCVVCAASIVLFVGMDSHGLYLPKKVRKYSYSSRLFRSCLWAKKISVNWKTMMLFGLIDLFMNNKFLSITYKFSSFCLKQRYFCYKRQILFVKFIIFCNYKKYLQNNLIWYNRSWIWICKNVSIIVMAL